MSISTWRAGVDLILKLYYDSQLTRSVLDDFRYFLQSKDETDRWTSESYRTLIYAAWEFIHT